jgi:hypothetical protein
LIVLRRTNSGADHFNTINIHEPLTGDDCQSPISTVKWKPILETLRSFQKLPPYTDTK